VEVKKDEEPKVEDCIVASVMIATPSIREYRAAAKNKISGVRSSTLASIGNTTQSSKCPRALLLKNSYSVLQT